MKRLTGVPLNRGYLAVTSVMLGALLIGGGTGTAHAYTDSDTAEQPPNTVRSYRIGLPTTQFTFSHRPHTASHASRLPGWRR